MTSPLSVRDDSAVSPTSDQPPPISERVVRAGIGLAKLARSPSTGSLNGLLSLVNDSTATEQRFRICTHCANLLDAREKRRARRLDQPTVCRFYDEMRACMKEASQRVQTYDEMWRSFEYVTRLSRSAYVRRGESTYRLEDARALRTKIAKLAESIDSISERISLLGTRCVENPPQDRQLRLHRMVRASAMIFLKEELSSVRALPSEERYAQLRRERRTRVEARIAYERRLEEERRRETATREQRGKRDTCNLEIRPVARENQVTLISCRSTKPTNVPSSLFLPNVVLDRSQGWGPSTVAPAMPSSTDPVIQQMSNLRAYVEQARADCRYDEVATLESNLKELRSVYFAMKRSNDSDE
ncbi:unnamed protein product [Heterotrigona itama]|uniref:Rabenosyn Rab binding domain-containing protein n=1 Tax=Heterotrigona itama TaxID=395501 RepID=A0A6V7HG83_9HYME|nr:unnamed protein product [Heterotrigona itama]